MSINKDLPYVAELKNLLIKTADLGDLLKSALSELRGIRYALVYGSFASGEESASSDIDILIIGSDKEEHILAALDSVETAVGREIN